MLEIKEEYKKLDIVKIATEHYVNMVNMEESTQLNFETEYNRIKNIKDVPYEIYIVLYNLYEKAIEQNVVLKIQIKTINSILAKIGFYLFEMDIETRKKYIDFAFTTYNEENRYKVLVEVDEKKEELFKKFLDEICIKQNIFFINSEEKIIYKHQEK